MSRGGLSQSAPPVVPASPLFSSERLAVLLGALWLLDGLLELQPSQFRGDLALSTQMNAMAQPRLLATALLGMGQLLAREAAWWNALICLLQLALGAAIIWRRTRRLALLAASLWALAVWLLGEGMGQVLTGWAMLPTGAPGAALLYALVGLVLGGTRGGSRAAGWRERCDTAAHHRRAAPPLARTADPRDRPSGGLTVLLGAAPAGELNELIEGEPGVLGALDHRLSLFTGTHGGLVTAALLLAEAAALLACRHGGRLGSWPCSPGWLGCGSSVRTSAASSPAAAMHPGRCRCSHCSRSLHSRDGLGTLLAWSPLRRTGPRPLDVRSRWSHRKATVVVTVQSARKKWQGRSHALDLDGIDFDTFRERPLDQRALRALRYMHDVEHHTVCYLRDLLVTGLHRTPR